MRRVGLALTLLVLTGCAAVHQPSASGSEAIPWLPLAADLTPVPVPSPQPMPVPSGTPPCTASQLAGGLEGSQGATGHIVTSFAFAGSGKAACFLEGTPSVMLLDAQGKPILFPQRTPYFPPTVVGPALVEPGPTPLEHTALKYGEAGLTIDWISQPEACWTATPSPAAVATAVIGIPAGGSLSIAIPDSKVAYACAGLGVGTFESPPAPVEVTPPPPLPAITIDAPTSARAGTSLRYLVTLDNDTAQPINLTVMCPNYEEELFLDTVGGSPPLEGKHFFKLNCKPAGTIPPGGHATFRMVLQIPPDAPLGTYTLVFGLGHWNAISKFNQKAVVRIT